MNTNVRFLLAASLMATAAAFTHAQVVNEGADVGETLGAAQSLAAGTTTVNGATGGDADLYKFGWGGGDFYVSTVGSNYDTQLFLFNGTGVGVQGNDDGIAFAGPSYLQVGGLAAGTYYLGVSGYDYDPYSASGLMFQSFPYEPLYGPLNGDPLQSWAGGSGGGNYTISFQQRTSNGDPVGNPNPTGNVPDSGSSIALVGLGLAGLVALRRKAAK